MNRVTQLETRIARTVDRAECVLLGHGTTAIFLALRALERRFGRGEVILPTTACPSLAQITLYAGFTPVFADVTIPDCTIDPEAVRTLIGPLTRAILPIHLFGNSAKMDRLAAVVEGRDIWIIEDAAQSLGGQTGGRKHGSFGTLSILSFGGTKVLRAGVGGALVTDDRSIASEVRASAAGLPRLEDSPAHRLKSLSHRNIYHGLMDLLRVSPEAEVGTAFASVLPAYRDLYLHDFPDSSSVSDSLSRGLEDLAANVNRRCVRASRYHESLARLGSAVTLSRGWEESGVSWRYTFLVNDPGACLAVTARLRKEGINASNHYWSVADLLYNEKSHPRSSYICPRVLNLWVDDVADVSYIQRSVAIIAEVLDALDTRASVG